MNKHYMKPLTHILDIEMGSDLLTGSQKVVKYGTDNGGSADNSTNLSRRNRSVWDDEDEENEEEDMY